VNESGKTLGEIVDGVKKVGDIISEIAAASKEQSSGIDQVNQAVTSMDELTQQNAALAEETSAASASMTDQSRDMKNMMDFFTVEESSPMESSKAKIKSSPVQSVVSSKKPAAQIARNIKPAATKINLSNDEDEWGEF
jgi:methyl-accepting chemotaxis protein